MEITTQSPTPEEVERTIELLEGLVTDGALLAQLPLEKRIALFQAAGRLSRPTKMDRRKRQHSLTKYRHKQVMTLNRSARANTGIRKARLDAVFKAPEQIAARPEGFEESQETPELKFPRNCYVCKAKY